MTGGILDNKGMTGAIHLPQYREIMFSRKKNSRMTRLIAFLSMLLAYALGLSAQQTISIDSCRSMAERNNRQLAIGRVQKDVSKNIRKSARTKYLPRITAVGGYELMSREISILSNAQQGVLNNLGTTAAGAISGMLTQDIMSLVQQGVITPDAAMAIQQQLGGRGEQWAAIGNKVGQTVTDAFKTDTRQMFAASVMVTQPVYMGGALTALNRMADIQESMAENSYEKQCHETRYKVDNTYWLVVSLSHKLALAKKYHELLRQLNGDVEKMIREGVATKADGLKVAVKLNESEMTLTQAENGIALARMLLCQQCGMPLDTQFTLYDETQESLPAVQGQEERTDIATALVMRPEIRLLEDVVALSGQMTRLTRASYLPQVMLTGGYLITNPNVYDSFHRSFAGLWNVGVMLRVPVWNWFDGAYKVRAAKGAVAMARYQLQEAKEGVELQVNQERYKLQEALRKRKMAESNIESAEENMRCASLGFHEGVISSTDVLGAQTAWYQAQSQRIDAEIDVRMCRLALDKALGVMR